MDDQRAAFEAWASRHTSTMHVELDHSGIYIHHATQIAWLAWQAATEATQCSSQMIALVRRIQETPAFVANWAIIESVEFIEAENAVKALLEENQ